MSDLFFDLGTTVAIQKPELDNLIAKLSSMGYDVIAPQVKDKSIVHEPLNSAADLPIGYTNQQEPGKFRLVKTNNQNYFNATPGSHSWKGYFFPPKSALMRFHKNGGNNSWSVQEEPSESPQFALLGVRPCDLAGIQIQDAVFLQEEWCDPVYRDRRSQAFIIAVNCLEPCGNCFCASMGTGPKAESGYDLCMTELEDCFLVEIGSEAGRMALGDDTITWKPASAFLLQSAQKRLDAAREKMGLKLSNPENLRSQLLENLDHPHWDDVAKRCMSCSSCTQVCPTCFCWDTFDTTILPGDLVVRERVWDSCFNPDYSYVFGGNTRPSTRNRYRQWLTHKFASWYDQFGVSGCVGCGRCITWCPAEINHLEEIAAIRDAGLSEVGNL